MRPKLACFALLPAFLFLLMPVHGRPQVAGGTVTGRVDVWDYDFKVGRVAPRTLLPGASVYLRSDQVLLEAKSDAKGKFRFDGVPPGDYEAYFLVDEPFFPSGPEFREVTVTESKPAIVNFIAGTDGRISGRLLRRDGSPAEGLSVCLGLAEPYYPEAPHAMRARSGHDGYFEFRRVPPGRYHLGLRLDPLDPPTLAYPRILFPGVEDPAGAAVIELAEGEELSNLDLVLPEMLRTRSLAGRVILPNGRPVASAQVVLEIADYPYTVKSGETTTDSTGRFSLPAFEGFSYKIRALSAVGSRIAESERRTVAKTGFLRDLTLLLRPVGRPKNLLANPSADDGFRGWTPYKETFIERVSGDPCFAVRNQGYILQDVALPEGSVGKYALLVGTLSTGRINEDNSITGLPYLYGYMMMSSQGRILSYLQGESMSFPGKRVNEWLPAYGVFPVPPETTMIRFFLNQAERKGDPQNGSLARFDDLGLYLFDSDEEARLFVQELSTSEWLREQAEPEPEDSITPASILMQCGVCVPSDRTGVLKQGDIVLKCEIGPDGKANSCEVHRGFRLDWDRLAIETVQARWQFTPATKDGVPITGSILVEVPLSRCQPPPR